MKNKMTGTKINLNHNSLFFEDFPMGTTVGIELKYGRETKLLNIQQNRDSVFIIIYDKTKLNLKYKQPRNGDKTYMWISRHSIDRRFMENYKDIAKSKDVITNFENYFWKRQNKYDNTKTYNWTT